MKSAITISLIPQAKGGPFVYWGDLAGSIARAAALKFDAVEIFAPSPEALSAEAIRPLLEQNNLKVAAVGTGGGWVLHKLSLSSPDASIRKKAIEFIRSIIDAGGKLGAPAIIGSMQGRWGDGVDEDTAIHHVADALNELGEHARQYHVPLIYEPLNRYETNIVTTLAQGSAMLKCLKTNNVKLLADLFHLNIEEADIAASIRHAAGDIGHVHLADSNRRPATLGHIDFAPIAHALAEISYGGYVSAECLPYPNSDDAARTTIDAFQKFFAPETPIGPH
ncbi:MAG TPA: sugar phosphate isomerase/epimerase family protein [Tepidisphaeraceae bacterium]|nr:sugar phosphate isomerase/epimerase family protein [Tepidisphaeraceae bacterium]